MPRGGQVELSFSTCVMRSQLSPPFSLRGAGLPGNQRGKHNNLKLKDIMIVVAAI
jgi:hypothetical protein